jgi:hypothetical protein
MTVTGLWTYAKFWTFPAGPGSMLRVLAEELNTQLPPDPQEVAEAVANPPGLNPYWVTQSESP